MDILIMILAATIVLGALVFIHEGGHFLAARAFGVRVTEFMLGLPGPNIGFTAGGTKFGVTPFLLGGYARVCGMEPGPMKPHLKEALAALHRRGTATMEDIAVDCGISVDESYEALEELVEWGSAMAPTKKDRFNTYRAPEEKPSRRALRAAAAAGEPAPAAYALGEARPVPDADALFESEYRQQYRSLPFWKRSVILVAGVAVNLLFAVAAFVVVFTLIGADVQYVDTGEVAHVHFSPLEAIQYGFFYIGAVVQAVAGLFNPATAAATVEGSTSIVGIAVMSKSAFMAGAGSFLLFMAMISTSLGIMNLLPIPPLDGGRFVIEVFQKLTRRQVSLAVMNGLSIAGMALFVCFFVVMLNQDVQRFVLGNW
ncbi:MAG TPA: site-2 protease family protein [Candidatus Aphodovivens avistercoris]|nr:site-2 protease family protein [Candidatus Aphodovivens avistercoris]